MKNKIHSQIIDSFKQQWGQHLLGRFCLSLPKCFEATGCDITVNQIEIKEYPMPKGYYKDKKFIPPWIEIKKNAVANYNLYKDWPKARGIFVEKDFSSHFSRPSIMLCYRNGVFHNIDLFVLMDEHILQLTEKKIIDDDAKIEELHHSLFYMQERHHYGKKGERPGNFFTEHGYIANPSTNFEFLQAQFECKLQKNLELNLLFSSLLVSSPDSDLPSIQEGLDAATDMKTRIDIIRDSEKSIRGAFKGHERIIFVKSEFQELLTAYWLFPGLSNDIAHPWITIELACSIDIREELLIVWDKILSELDPPL